jgi:hypothetical protein
MKVIEDGEFEDRYGRCPIRFQNAKSFQKVYDWLYSHYPDYKFAVIFDVTEEYQELDEIFAYFLGDVAEEAASETGMKLVYDDRIAAFWEEQDGSFQCTRCRKLSSAKTKFCPHCGKEIYQLPKVD